MRQIKKEYVFFSTLMAGIYLIAWMIQDKLFFNWDVSQLVHAARLLMNGGTYANDFFTPNPPVILYIYVIPVLLSKLLNVNFLLMFRSYIFLIASLSLWICYPLVRKIFLPQDIYLKNLFVITIAVIFLIVPVYHFAQRDHLWVILMMPYLLVVTCRLNNVVIDFRYFLMCGLLAGVGFAIKPQFLVPFILVELYYMAYKKNIFASMRIENFVIAGILAAQLIVLYIRFPDFLFIIFPYISHNYYNAIGVPWKYLIFNPITIFCLFPIAVHFIRYRENPYKILSTVLVLTLIGCIFSYLSQRTLMLYHRIPAFSFAILLLALQLGLFLKWSKHWFVILFVSIFLMIPIHIMYTLYVAGIAYKEHVLNKLVTFMRTQPPAQSVYFLSAAGSFASPLIDYTDAIYVGRFDCLWMVLDLVKRRHIQGDDVLRKYIKNNNEKDFFLNLIVDDFNKHKPNLVFVDISKNNSEYKGKNIYFDYLSYFLESQIFRDKWKSYRYLTTIQDSLLTYKLAVYQRRELL